MKDHFVLGLHCFDGLGANGAHLLQPNFLAFFVIGTHNFHDVTGVGAKRCEFLFLVNVSQITSTLQHGVIFFGDGDLVTKLLIEIAN